MFLSVPSYLGASKAHRFVWKGLLVYAIIQSILLFGIFVNHLNGPEITRGAMFESSRRILQGKSIYPIPSEEFVGLAYTPMFSVVGAISIRLVGENATALRLAAMVGTLGAGVFLCLILNKSTRSYWASIIGVGLFASAYFSFDAYLDYGNPDSWLLFLTLAGFYLCSFCQDRTRNLIGVLILTLGFWFKQQEAVMILAALTYLSYRNGLKESFLYWILAATLGPLAFFIGGPLLFGQELLYYTIQVPKNWTSISSEAMWRYVDFVLLHWVYLAHAALILFGVKVFGSREKMGIWIFSFPFVLSVGLLGVMDSGSENNVFLLPGVWFIILGMIALWKALKSANSNPSYRSIASFVAAGTILGSFALHFFNPVRAVIPKKAKASYRDIIQFVEHLDGVVYIPEVGQFQGDAELPIPVHWVHLEDLVRTSTGNLANEGLVREVLKDLEAPHKETFIITTIPLEEFRLLAYLSDEYVLVTDYGDRWFDLRALPGRFSGATWPRYLYKYSGS